METTSQVECTASDDFFTRDIMYPIQRVHTRLLNLTNRSVSSSMVSIAGEHERCAEGFTLFGCAAKTKTSATKALQFHWRIRCQHARNTSRMGQHVPAILAETRLFRIHSGSTADDTSRLIRLRNGVDQWLSDRIVRATAERSRSSETSVGSI